jgi:serine/threonine protein kinase
MDELAPSEFPRPFGPRCILLKELARGGMGRIFLATVGGRVCAVKTLHPDLADTQYVRRFLDEATLATQLSHPNLVYVSEAGSEEGSPYLAMEYLRGKNLNDLFIRCGQRKKHLPIGFAFFIMKEILRGLSYMHGIEGLKLVHRDLAPSNVVLTYDGAIKIIDLGLAKWRDRLAMTMMGDDEFGQRRYVSPEQKFGRPVDARSDLYSAGVIFWEMVVGRALERKVDKTTGKLSAIPGPSAVRPELITASLNNLIVGMLDDDPAERVQSAQEVIAELTPMLGAEYESSALQSFLADLFADEIRREADEEKSLVAKAKEIVPAVPVSPVLTPAESAETTMDMTSDRKNRRRLFLLLAGLGFLLTVAGTWFALRPRAAGTNIVATAPTSPPVSPAKPPVDAGQPSRPVPTNAPSAVVAARPSSARLLEEAKDLLSKLELAKASSIAERAVKANGDDLEARILLGDIYMRSGMYEKALVQYQEALRIFPNETAALRGRERALAGLRQR